MVAARRRHVKPGRLQTTDFTGFFWFLASFGARGYRCVMSAPLACPPFSLAGPGRVASSLAGWAVAAGAELVAVAGRGALGELASGGQGLLPLALPGAGLAAGAAGA